MKRTAVIALVLLLQISLQETEAADTLKPLTPSEELKQLKDIMYQQGTTLAELRTEMKYMEKENSEIRHALATSQSDVNNLKKENTALKTKTAKQMKQTKQTQYNMEGLMKEISEIRHALETSQSDVNNLKEENTALKGRLSTAEGDVAHVKREVIEHPKVAFSAALSSTVGPTSGETALVFPKVITNVGGAYNKNTGVFTAPARGVYYFRFTLCSENKGYYTGLYLYHNKKLLTYLYAYLSGYRRYLCGGVTVQLEIGDIIYARLPSENYMIYDGGTIPHNIFTGFILFSI